MYSILFAVGYNYRSVSVRPSHVPPLLHSLHTSCLSTSVVSSLAASSLEKPHYLMCSIQLQTECREVCTGG